MGAVDLHAVITGLLCSDCGFGKPPDDVCNLVLCQLNWCGIISHDRFRREDNRAGTDYRHSGCS